MNEMRLALYKEIVEEWAKKHDISYKSALSLICKDKREPFEWLDFDELSWELYDREHNKGA